MLQMHPSQNVNKISKRTIKKLNLKSFVHFQQVKDKSAFT